MSDDAQELAILLVEDNQDDVEIVRRALSRSGVRAGLAVATDGRKALESLLGTEQGAAPGAERTPSVVILDLMLPFCDGVSILRRVRADPFKRDIPIVVLTGSDDVQLLQKCVELGTNMYVLKPIDMGDVISIVLGVRKYWQSEPELARAA